MHWAEAYVGRSYVPGTYDCADLVVDVMRDQFHWEIDIPTQHGTSIRARDNQINASSQALASPTEAPREGDAVLMRMAGRTRPIGHHIGVWCDIDGTAHVLHCIERIGTCLHKLDALGRYGLNVVETYRWNRH